MPDQTIVCPNCGKEIPLTETLFHCKELGSLWIGKKGRKGKEYVRYAKGTGKGE